MTRILLLTNADAGSADQESVEAALAVLRESATVEVRATSGPDELDEAVAALDGRVLVVAGGDGSVHAVVAALHRAGQVEQVTLGLIPLGTGNDFARGEQIPLEPDEAARVVLSGTVRSVDLMVDDRDEVVVNNVRMGMGADASRRAASWKKRLGRVGYALGAASAVLRPKLLPLRIEVDGELVAGPSGPVLDLSIGNGPTVGGGLAVHPTADPESRQLDVVIALATGRRARIGYALYLARARHLECDNVRHRTATEVRVSGATFHATADGEQLDPANERTWRIQPAALRMLLPAKPAS